MSFKVLTGKVGVALHDIDDDGTPGFDVAGLGFVEKDEGADDVGTETVEERVSRYWFQAGRK